MIESSCNNGLTICMLASGSAGNCILISSGDTSFLIDAGLSCRELTRRLASVGVAAQDISAVVVTHEHQDHTRGVGVFSRKHAIPVYMNARTLEGACGHVGDVPSARIFSTGDVLEIGGLTVRTYPVLHDAADPIGLTVANTSKSVGIVLDMGHPTGLVKERLRGSNALVLEFNHDPELLRQCTRPWELKQRILSKRGHLSNEAALDFMCELVHDQLQTVIPAHISREANSSELVYSVVSDRLKEIGRSDIKVFPAAQNEVGRPIKV